jgi:hypothetical protein
MQDFSALITQHYQQHMKWELGSPTRQRKKSLINEAVTALVGHCAMSQ